MTLPALDTGLEWNNQIAVDGSIAVVTITGGPEFDSLMLSGGNLILGGSGGTSNKSYVVFSSTNLAERVLNWIPVSTNPVNPTQPQEYFQLQLP